MNSVIQKWKQPAMLLTAVGISGLGNFIYLVAINILIYDMTGSAAVVALLWVVGPAVNVLTKFWTGSFIDYRSKRNIMIAMDIIRAVFVFCIPSAPNVVMIFVFLIALSVAKAFFGPASITYITNLIPKEMRKRYNAIQSMTISGAFIIGPSIGGVLILAGSVDTAIYINAISFLFSALLLYFLPDNEKFDHAVVPRMSIRQIKDDWMLVLGFFKVHIFIAAVYSSYLATMIIAFAMDAQEVVFTQAVVGLSKMDYTLLISITGIGDIAGGLIVASFSKKLSLRFLISIGILMQAAGYIIYAFSWSFLSIVTGFIVLGFFNAFANAGIMTFYQNNIPANLMGRITSMFQLIQSAIQIIFVVSVGAIADIIPLRITIISLAIAMLAIAVILAVMVTRPAKNIYFKEVSL